jgi:CRP/FNR family transcriptional regulator, cyclic AMP receptor protein
MRKVLYIFGLLTDADVEWIARSGIRRRLRDGEVVITEGKKADFLILLLEGELLVTAQGFGQVARLGIGEIVGEMSLVDSALPSATVTAHGDGLALFIEKTRLVQKLDADEGFGSRFYRALAIFLADRLRASRRLSSEASSAADETQILKDQLDAGILDNVSAAGDRFWRMLKMLRGNHE